MEIITNRAAKPGDGPHLVKFVIMAGEGLPELSWAEMTEPGETIHDVGLRRATRDEGSFPGGMQQYLSSTGASLAEWSAISWTMCLRI